MKNFILILIFLTCFFNVGCYENSLSSNQITKITINNATNNKVEFTSQNDIDEIDYILNQSDWKTIEEQNIEENETININYEYENKGNKLTICLYKDSKYIKEIINDKYITWYESPEFIYNKILQKLN